MYTVKCLNPIADKGLDLFTEDFKVIDDLKFQKAFLQLQELEQELTIFH